MVFEVTLRPDEGYYKCVPAAPLSCWLHGAPLAAADSSRGSSSVRPLHRRDGQFSFSFNVPHTYPHEAPKVKCLTKVFHPNIDLEGNICLNILRRAASSTCPSILFGLAVPAPDAVGTTCRLPAKLPSLCRLPQGGLEAGVEHQLDPARAGVPVP